MLEIAAAVSEPQAGVEKGGKHCDKTNLTVLEAGFSTGDYSYRFEIKSNGTGVIFFSECLSLVEDFAHELSVETLRLGIEKAVKSGIELQSQTDALDALEIQNICDEITAEKLEDIFWEEINQTLEDPFFRSFYDDEWGEEFRCERGRTEEFEEFLELCVLTERKIESPDDYLIIEAETDFETSGLSECSYFSERLGELTKIACDYFKPTGHRYDYNDGCYDRYSGYSMSSESISVSLRESANTPTREKMLGMMRLKEKLAAMKIADDTIRRLTAF